MDIILILLLKQWLSREKNMDNLWTMDDEEVKVIAEDFDGFIDYVWNRK